MLERDNSDRDWGCVARSLALRPHKIRLISRRARQQRHGMHVSPPGIVEGNHGVADLGWVDLDLGSFPLLVGSNSIYLLPKRDSATSKPKSTRSQVRDHHGHLEVSPPLPPLLTLTLSAASSGWPPHFPLGGDLEGMEGAPTRLLHTGGNWKPITSLESPDAPILRFHAFGNF